MPARRNYFMKGQKKYGIDKKLSEAKMRSIIYESISEYEELREQNNNFYWSKKWRKTSKTVRLRDDNIDVWEYLKTGRKVSGAVVHHIIPRSENPNLEFDMNNLITLSQSSHSEIEAIYSNCPERKAEIQNILLAEAKLRTELLVNPKLENDENDEDDKAS